MVFDFSEVQSESGGCGRAAHATTRLVIGSGLHGLVCVFGLRLCLCLTRGCRVVNARLCGPSGRTTLRCYLTERD